MDKSIFCQNKGKSNYCMGDFIITPDDYAFYEKMNVPPPTFCPECRMIRRFNFRNEGMLFKRPDAHTGMEIFSTFSKSSPIKTYQNNFWYGDSWDPYVFGIKYDFSKTFFEQYKELLSQAPVQAQAVYSMLNSDYCNEAGDCKNCYLCFNVDYSETCAYVRKVRNGKECFDCYECEDIELCYECVLVNKSYKTFYSEECDSCVDVWFSKSLKGCTNCFGCVNLRNKSYYFFNKPYSKEEYEIQVKDYMQESDYTTVQKNILESRVFWEKFPVKFYVGSKNNNSTGDRLFNTKNVFDSYFVKNTEEARYCQDLWLATSNVYDYSVWGHGAHYVYECISCGMGIYNLKFCFNCWEDCQNLEYCGYCIGSKDCFGCVGLYKKQYCIFNIQYTKEEYESMIIRIKEHMDTMPYIDLNNRKYAYGEFFPHDLSPIAYNESLAQDFFSLTKEEVIQKGYVWFDRDRGIYQISMKTESIPPKVSSLTENICNEIIECATCHYAFRIIESELQFYKKYSIPVPHMCHECRFTQRFASILKPVFYERECMASNCTNIFKTNHSPESKTIVYCESCYLKEVN